MSESELIKRYVLLIEQFTEGEISADRFEEIFRNTFLGEKIIISEEVYVILNKLFTDVDAFCADEALREDDDIDENELLRCAKKALKDLRSL